MQSKNHEQANDRHYTVGTYVNTLSMQIDDKTFVREGISHLIRLEPNNFKARNAPWCYLVGGTFVVCKGVVVGTCPKEHDPASGRNARIARLPANLRPKTDLKFAALVREAHDLGGSVTYSAHLVTLTVDTDGWICGFASREPEGALDLSAIRFCVGGGISLVDEVSLHTVDIAGTRLVNLQGCMSDRFFAVHSHKALALLPESCRPPGDRPFVVAGASFGGYHLLVAKAAYGLGCGGDLTWRDSVWNRDKIHFTGIMYEISPDALQFSTLNAQWSGEQMSIFVQDFQNFLVRKFGSIEEAWHVAFDTDGSGSVNFTEFGLGCKASGYVGNATRLWAAFDEDRSGDISLDELGGGMGGDEASAIEDFPDGRSDTGSQHRKMTLTDLLEPAVVRRSKPSLEADGLSLLANLADKKDIHEQSTELPSEPSQDWGRPGIAESASSAQLPGMMR